MRKLITIFAVALLWTTTESCTKSEEHHPNLMFTWDGKPYSFETQAVSYESCGVRNILIEAMYGERYFRIHVIGDQPTFWTTYSGVSYTARPFLLTIHREDSILRASFSGGLVRDGFINAKIIYRDY